MLRLLRHFDHNFDASLTARPVQLVSVDDIGEWHAVCNDSTHVDPAIGD